MNNLLKKLLFWILSVRRGEIVTYMPSARITERAMSVGDEPDGRYRCYKTDDGFVIAEKISRRLYGGIGRLQNSFAPLAAARITEDNGYRRVEYTVRMRYFPLAVTLMMRVIFTYAFLVGIISGVMLLASLVCGGGADPELTYYLSMALPLPILELFVRIAYVPSAKKLECLLSELIAELESINDV